VRGRRLGIAATATGLLALSGVAAVAMGVMPLVAAAVPAAIETAALAITRRDYRRTLARAQVALEQILDRLEYGAPKSSPAQSLLDAFIGTPRLPK
jgi:hypothetical protein